MKIEPNLKKEIKKYFLEKIRTKKKKAIIITPYPLKKEEKEIFYRFLPWLREMELENTIDKELIGGFVLKINSMVFDGSITGRINNLINQIK